LIRNDINHKITPNKQNYEEYLEIINAMKQTLVQYDVPLKTSLEKDCYAIAWPIMVDDGHSESIENKLIEFLDYRKFQTEDMSYDEYLKYKNTKLFYEYCKRNLDKVSFKVLEEGI
jgi:hypothetical protein